MSSEARAQNIDDHNLTFEEVADIIWLAYFMDAPGQNPQVSSSRDTSNEIALSSHSDPQAKDHSKVSPPIMPGGKEQLASAVDGGRPPQPAQGELHVPSPISSQDIQPDNQPSLSGVKYPTPEVSALPEKLAIMRSLRPLLQRVPSKTQFDLDEDETAERIANAGAGGWSPALRSVAERPFDLVLLIDKAPTMAIWRRTVRELQDLLIQTGIFRNVHTWMMVLDESKGSDGRRRAHISLRVDHADQTGAARTYQARELIDPQQRRLVLVLSDCTSAAWDNGAVMQLLKPLAAVNFVTILHLLPEFLWNATALTNAVYATFSGRAPLVSNRQLAVEVLQRGWSREEVKNWLAIPVITLAPDDLAQWATFVTGRQQERVLGYYFLSDALDQNFKPNPAEIGAESPPAKPKRSIEDQYKQFLGTLPSLVRRLAAYWAAVPLTLPVMRLIQNQMLKEATHADFAQLFYSGLIERKSHNTDETDIDELEYDFVGGDEMRRRLRGTIPNYRIEQVFDELSRYISQQRDRPDSFDAVLYVPGVSGNLVLNERSRRFARVSVGALRYLGGFYDILADQIEQLIAPPIPVVMQPVIVQPDGVSLWVSASLPDSIEVGQNVKVTVNIYAGQTPEQSIGASTTLYKLGTFAPGEQIEIQVDASDGSFISLDETPLTVTVEGGIQPATALVANLQTNALGKGVVCFAFVWRGDQLAPLELPCTITPIKDDPVRRLTLLWDADDLYETSKYEAAEAKYTAAIERGEDTPDVYQRRGQARHNQGKSQAAEADYNAALARGVEDYWLYIDRGNIRQLQKKYPAAIRDFKAAIELNPENANAYNNRGLAYQALGKMDEALADFAHALEIDPQYKWAARNRGELYRKQGDYQQAIVEFNHALTIDANYMDAYNSRGLAYHALGDTEAALADFARALEIDPQYKWAYYKRGTLYRQQSDYEKAIAEFNQVITIDPNYSAGVYNERGLAHENLGNGEAALADYARALEIDPQYKWAYYNRGSLYRKRRDYQQAVAEYDQALTIDPAYEASVYNERGLAHENLGNGEAALADYARALELDPQYKWAARNRGNFYRKRRDYQQAIAAYNQALAIDPEYAASVYNERGLVSQAIGDTETALTDYARALEIDPKYKWAAYNRGNIYGKQGKYQQAIDAFNQAVTIDPEYTGAYNSRGLAHEELKDTDAALADFARALEIDPQYKRAYYNRNRVFQKLKNMAAAEQELRNAIKFLPDDGEVYLWLGQFYLAAGRFNDARASFEQAETKYSDALAKGANYDLYYGRGLVYENLYRWQQAIDNYTSALALQPNATHARLKRGIGYFWIRAYDKAIADYSSILKQDAHDINAYHERAFAYYEQRDYQKAREDCEQAIKHAPSNAYGFMLLGLLHARLQKTDLAIEDANRALARAQDDGVVHRFCSMIFFWVAHYDKAIEHGQRAILLAPNLIWESVWLGHSYLMLGDLASAQAHYKTAIEQRPDRYFWQAKIEELQALQREHPARWQMIQQCIALFENALRAVAA